MTTKHLESVYNAYNLSHETLANALNRLEISNKEVKEGVERSTYNDYIQLRAILRVAYGIRKLPRDNDGLITIARRVV